MTSIYVTVFVRRNRGLVFPSRFCSVLHFKVHHEVPYFSSRLESFTPMKGRRMSMQAEVYNSQELLLAWQGVL